MIKETFTKKIAENTNLSKNDAKQMTDLIIRSLTEILVAGKVLKISGFGVFRVVHKKQRMGRNPKNKEPHVISPRRVASYLPSKYPCGRKRKLFSYTPEEILSRFHEGCGGKMYKAISVYKWVYQRGVREPDAMTDIGKSLRSQIKNDLRFELPKIETVLKSTDGSYKFLYLMADGYKIETVAMNHDDHFSVCVSSQVGCAMGCKFCMTGTMGLKRNLTAAEIVGQVYQTAAYLAEREAKSLRNIVYMGMGEPFHNYENVVQSLRILINGNGMNFGNRRVTVSTSGLIPQIERFLKEEKANLAISLNSVDAQKRAELMPISKKYPLEILLKTCREYTPELKKRITFEYIMMRGVNDSPEDAVSLSKLLQGIKAKINLIPYNMNNGLGFERSEENTVNSFQSYLLNRGFVATVRYSKGQDIAAACGQLVNIKKTA
ncbi:hypothetical protein CHS0354_027407 [Potamilus streckersoni]|uniref:Radical SAM core domain-containing protein n=1 Tax=Potamilus streckersoni TaxID=2493646 RepID=A0AAE0SQ36_9BIVA|nr:hypothetical protein CHS0354_027407 [Potamilus streckersoni]